MEHNYPTVLRRYFSTVLDGIFIISVFIGTSYLFSHDTEFMSIIRLTIILFVFLFYEPVFTSRFCTIGQKITGIRVRRSVGNDFVRLPVISAYIRLIVKVVLGIISFFTIPFTKRRRAIHDFAADSVVIPADFSPDTDTFIDASADNSESRKKSGGFGKIVASICLFLLTAIIIIGAISPDTAVISGSGLRKDYRSIINELGLLEPDEKIIYFYSDGLFSIKEGFYFLSDRKVAIYAEDAPEPLIMIPFDDISDTSIEYSDSFLEDTDLFLTLKDENIIWFPLSNEKNGDKKFYNQLLKYLKNR